MTNPLIAPPVVQIVGRTSSHFTRVAAMFAHELGVPFELVVVYDLTSLASGEYGGNPALKLPTLRIGPSETFGTENICRRLTEHAGRAGDPRIVWPESLTADVARNAQELTWHAMAAHVQLIVGIGFGKLPAENLYFAKIREGLCGALAWLDANLHHAREALPAERDVSLFEVTLFCLVEHLEFRTTVSAAPYGNLRAFAAEYGARASAMETVYRFDRRPTP